MVDKVVDMRADMEVEKAVDMEAVEIEVVDKVRIVAVGYNHC